MDSWTETVRQFYAEALSTSGFNLNEKSLAGGNLKDLPQIVIETFNRLGGADADPLPGLYKIQVNQKDTYGITLTWGGGDGWMAVLDTQQLLGVAYVENEGDSNSIQWSDSFAAMGGE